jgi:hypothetical protein
MGLAFLMAVIGSVIVDQILYADDILKQKEISIQEDVDAIYNSEKKQIELKISRNLENQSKKSAQIEDLAKELSAKPSITLPTRSRQTQQNSDGEIKTTTVVVSSGSTSVPNPKFGMMELYNEDMATLNKEYSILVDELKELRNSILTRLKRNKGFLSELKILFTIIGQNFIAFAFYVLVFLFLFFLEILIVLVKFYGDSTDLEKLISHQMDFRNLTLEKYSNS